MDSNNKIAKIIKITAAIFVIIFIVLLAYTYTNQNSSKRIIKKLQKNGYEEGAKDIFIKTSKEDYKEYSYTYNIKLEEFSKTTSVNDENEMQTTISTINKNNNIIISYIYRTTGCSLNQEATYTNKKEFTCNVTQKKGSCKAKCNLLLEEAKDMVKEKNKLLK